MAGAGIAGSQIPLAQKCDWHSSEAVQRPPSATAVRVRVGVGVAVGVTVGVLLGVLVGVAVVVGELVGVCVGVSGGVAGGVSGGISVGVQVGVSVGEGTMSQPVVLPESIELAADKFCPVAPMSATST